MSTQGHSRWLLSVLFAASLPAFAACESKGSAQRASASQHTSTGTASVAEAGIGAEWPQAPGNVQSTRYSTLNQITVSNVSTLKLAWTFSTGTLRGREAAPVIVNNTMYIVTPYPNYLYALDLTKGGALKWMYKPRPAAAAQGVACCHTVNRGVAYVDGKIINTLDAHTIAVNADTGQELWRAYNTGPDKDHDGINENVLVDLTLDGKPRKVILRPERNGYMYVLDRLTGEVHLRRQGGIPSHSYRTSDREPSR